MGTGYTRNDTGNNIADGNVINASDLDGEFDAIQSAFNGSTGHSHDGTTGEGPQIDTAGIANDAVDSDKLDETDSYTVAGLSVTGNTTLGDAATDTVTFTADVASNILPNADGTLSLGASGSSWGDAYVTTVYLGGTEVTATAAELNLLDGVTATTAELNILDGVTSTSSELNLVDGSTAGTVVNSKAVIYGASGEVNATTLQVGGSPITATPAELNTLDGITSTTAELNILDGVTATTAELNILDGVTATTAELNYNDITTLGTVEASKTVTADANGDVKFGDNDKALFGAGSDLEIFHDGSNSFIAGKTGENKTVVVKPGGSGSVLITNSAGDNIITQQGDVANLHYDGNTKLATTTDGIDVTGKVTANGLDMGDGSGAFNNKIVLGAADDLQIYHDGSHSYIDDTGTGDLYIRASDDLLLQKYTGESMLTCNVDASVDLFYNNSKKFETTANGVDVTGRAEGTVTTDNDGGFNLNSSNYFICTPSGSLDITFTNETTGVAGAILLVNTTPQTVTVGPDVFLSDADLTAINSAGTYLLGFYCPDGTNVYMSATPALTEGS